MRWRMFVNGLRSIHGLLDLGATGIAWLFYSVFGLGFGLGLCAAAYSLASHSSWQYLPILFWVMSFLWLMFPVLVASFQEQSDLGILLRFPVHFGSYFLLYLISGLMEASTIVGVLCCLGVWFGIVMARPDLYLWAMLGLAVFAAFNILLVRAVFAWIDRWLSQRKTREIVGALFMVLILSMQLMNPAIWQHGHQRQGRLRQRQQIEQLLAEPWVKTADEVQRWLPPGLAAVALGQAAEQQPKPALESLGVMGLFLLGAGSVLGLRLRAEYRGENLGSAPARKKPATRPGKTMLVRDKAAEREGEDRLGESKSNAPAPIAAIIEKEIRSLPRTLPLLYAVGAPMVLVLVISGSFIRGASHGHMPLLSLPLCMFFAQIGFRQLFANSLGTEGPGIQLYFLCPTPMRTVLLAKNLFHSAVFVLVLVIAGFLATLRLGQPDGMVVAATVAWFLFVLPCSLAAGNIFSLTMPFRVNPGRISRQPGSQASALLSLVMQAGMVGVGAAVFELCSIGGMLWLAVPIFLALAAIAVFAWVRILGNSDEIANRNKDLLIATLMKAE
jgi:ABC-2 type transport system permease protein